MYRRKGNNLDEQNVDCNSYDVCANAGRKCDICFNAVYFTPKKEKHVSYLKKHSERSNRQGARFEQKNHENNNRILTNSAVSDLTPNSGAGYIKGDEHISGIISVMEELKTKTTKQTKGKETFTIHKAWLDKLTREAIQENKEFWYLKFSFFEDNVDWYCILSNDIVMSFVKTLVKDREKAKNADRLIELANRQKETAESKNLYLSAKIKELEAEIAVLKENTKEEP
jgi:hypothetical protein